VTSRVLGPLGAGDQVPLDFLFFRAVGGWRMAGLEESSYLASLANTSTLASVVLRPPMYYSAPFLSLLLALVLVIMAESGSSSGGGSNSESDHHSLHHHVLEGIKLPFQKFLDHHHHHHHHQQHDHTNSTTERTPATQPVAPTLRFNGAGVRSVNFFGWDFKVYVAGFYHAAQHVMQDAETVFHAVNHHPMQLDFTFLRSVNQAKVTEAWQKQLEHSVDFTYDGFEKDRDDFIRSFGPIENGGTESVVLLQDGRTVMVDQGVPKGVIYNKQFQRAFLSMWFGSKAVAPDLKLGLLGGFGHFGLQPHGTERFASEAGKAEAVAVGVNGNMEEKSQDYLAS